MKCLLASCKWNFSAKQCNSSCERIPKYDESYTKLPMDWPLSDI